MIIQEIVIENFLCYYDIKSFPLAKGLNIILGENGEGKTKFFEAIEWLFKNDNKELERLVSAKKLAEVAIDDIFKVRVSLIAKQYDTTKILSKYFTVKKTNDNACSTSNIVLEGIEESNSGERNPVDGQRLMDQLFPFTIRRYSMFKGESELDIFKSDDALLNLINSFSEAKHYDKYAEKSLYLKTEAEKAVEQATKKETGKKSDYQRLENEIQQLEDKKVQTQTFLNITNENARKTNENLADVANHINNAEELETINTRIASIEQKITNVSASIEENYTTMLFDEKWLLMHFEPLHKEFASKVNDLSIRKRELQSEFDRELGIKEGERRAKAELFNKSIPLPDNVPTKAIMEEMLKDKVCKVCNTPAPEGSKPYKFMADRLQQYIENQSPTDENKEPEKLFEFDYTSRLVNLTASHEDSLAHLRDTKNAIKELFDFNNDRRKQLEELNKKLEIEITNRDRVLGNSAIGATKLTDVLKNYNSWQDSLKNLNREIVGYEKELEDLNLQLKTKKAEKEKIDLATASNFLIKTRAILRDIETIFCETKEKKFDEFIHSLEIKSNEYFERINKRAFTGNIVFNKQFRVGKPVVLIELQEDGRILYKPNQSLLTSMHISILFGISELASQKSEEGYPIIFDAPTSSFGENKTGAFLNIISETGNQIILLTKDFIADDSKGTLHIKPEFGNIKRDKAFWIKVERPFDSKVLKTINTEVITL